MKASFFEHNYTNPPKRGRMSPGAASSANSTVNNYRQSSRMSPGAASPATSTATFSDRPSRSGSSRKQSSPKMVGKKNKGMAPTGKAKTLAAKLKNNKLPAKKKTRHRSASGSAAKVNIAGRHTPSNFRYKTGYWRPVRQSWMTNEVWEAFKAINRFRHKAMSKGMKAASLGKPIYGKEGPGHAGYGTGHLQHWADKILRQGDGTDPHLVDLVKWFKGAAAAFDYHNGEKDFKALEKLQREDPDHFMRRVIESLKNSIPELKKLSKRGVNDLIRNKFYTVQYGPDGRAK